MEETVRGALAGSAGATAEDADAVLGSLGWLGMLEEHPGDAIAVVFRSLGATNAVASALDDVLATALGLAPREDLAIVLPAFARWDPPARIRDGAIVAQGLATVRAATARELLVVVGGGATGSRAARLSREAVRLEPVKGVDPALGLHAVRVDVETAQGVDEKPADWPAAVALGRRALGHQIAGACRAMLDLARSHALERSQFGRPIARFQAVRHRLAEAYVAIESLDAALDAARETPCPETASLAKAVAGRAVSSVTTHCQQVLAGIGFTTEHAFHRFMKRAMVLEGLFGSADAIVLDEGRRLLATGEVPTLVEL
jgi:hypothetical protein